MQKVRRNYFNTFPPHFIPREIHLFNFLFYLIFWRKVFFFANTRYSIWKNGDKILSLSNKKYTWEIYKLLFVDWNLFYVSEGLSIKGRKEWRHFFLDHHLRADRCWAYEQILTLCMYNKKSIKCNNFVLWHFLFLPFT